METIEFTVTEKAGAFVAGQRSPGLGQPVQLTREQAHYALEAGELQDVKPEPETAKKPAKTDEA